MLNRVKEILIMNGTREYIILAVFLLAIGLASGEIKQTPHCTTYENVQVIYESDDTQATQIIGDFHNGTLYICQE